MLNQIGRRFDRIDEFGEKTAYRHRLLLLLDEFPSLGKLDFFETALAVIAGYGLKAVLIAQSLNQLEKAYGPHNAILDNCHIRLTYAANDDRTAKRISDLLGQSTEKKIQKSYSGSGLCRESFGERAGGMPRALLTPPRSRSCRPTMASCWSGACFATERVRSATFWTGGSGGGAGLPPAGWSGCATARTFGAGSGDWDGLVVAHSVEGPAEQASSLTRAGASGDSAAVDVLSTSVDLGEQRPDASPDGSPGDGEDVWAGFFRSPLAESVAMSDDAEADADSPEVDERPPPAMRKPVRSGRIPSDALRGTLNSRSDSRSAAPPSMRPKRRRYLGLPGGIWTARATPRSCSGASIGSVGRRCVRTAMWSCCRRPFRSL